MSENFVEKFEYIYSGGFEKTAEVETDEALGRVAFKQYEFLKTAAAASSFNMAAKGLFNALKAMAPAAAIGAGIFGAKKVLSTIQESRLQKDMMKSYEYVKKNGNFTNDNPQVIHEAFSTLQTFAPSIAAKPLAAKTFVELVANRGGVDPELLKQVAAIQKDYSSGQDSAGLFDYAKGVGDIGGAGKNIHGLAWPQKGK